MVLVKSMHRGETGVRVWGARSNSVILSLLDIELSNILGIPTGQPCLHKLEQCRYSHRQWTAGHYQSSLL